MTLARRLKLGLLGRVVGWLARPRDEADRRTCERQAAAFIQRRGGSLTDETERLIGELRLGRRGY